MRGTPTAINKVDGRERCSDRWEGGREGRGPGLGYGLGEGPGYEEEGGERGVAALFFFWHRANLSMTCRLFFSNSMARPPAPSSARLSASSGLWSVFLESLKRYGETVTALVISGKHVTLINV